MIPDQALVILKPQRLNLSLMRHLVYIIFIFLIVKNVQASPVMTAESNAMRVTTSDRAYREEVNFSFRQKTVLVTDELTEQPKKEMQFGSNILLNQGYSTQDLYTGAKGTLFAIRDFNLFKVEGSVGVHNLRNETTKKSHDIMVGSGKFTWNPDGVVEASLEGMHDYVYTDLFQPGGARSYITTSGGTPSLIIRPTDRTKLYAWNSWKYLSDNNVQTQGETGAMYAVSEDRKSLWLGLGADQIRFKHWTPNYWSPDRVSGIGAKVESDMTFAKRWTSVVKCSFGRGYDNGPKTWGWGYYLSALLRYKMREHFQFEFYMNRLETNIDADRWYLSQFGLNASAPF